MKIIAITDGPFELSRELMGFETFAMALYDQQDLVERIFERIETLLLYAHRKIAEYETVGAVHMGDDLCYKTGPMMAPALFRRFVFPIHRKIAETAHASGRPFSLHSDGDNTLLMEDLIEYVKIDAKHAFEDSAQPVEQVKKDYGDRIALLGGVDMNLLCSADEGSIRRRVIDIVETCKAGGGFAIGSGNSVATYIPTKNYRLMLKTALEAGWY
jgi:uroporphyrinogen decarboxylase